MPNVIERRSEPLRYGLQSTVNRKLVCILQISNGRILLSDGARSWWEKPHPYLKWTVVPASMGQTYSSIVEAKQVAKILSSP